MNGKLDGKRETAENIVNIVEPARKINKKLSCLIKFLRCVYYFVIFIYYVYKFLYYLNAFVWELLINDVYTIREIVLYGIKEFPICLLNFLFYQFRMQLGGNSKACKKNS